MKIAAGIAAALALLVIGVIVAIATVDVARFIGPVQARVKAATGRDLAVNGGGSLSLSLQPRLVLSDVALGNAPWASAPQMVKAKRLELQVELLPLISRRLEVVEFALVEPAVALETDATGRKNWEFTPTAVVATPLGPPTATSSGTLGAIAALGVGNTGIVGGTVSYRDGKSGKTTHIAIDKMSLRARDAASPIAVEFEGKADDVALSFVATLGPLAALAGERWPYPVEVKGTVGGRSVMVATKLSAKDKVYRLDELKAAFGSAAVTGDVAIAIAGERPVVSFRLFAPSLTPADLAPVAAAGAKVAAAPAQPAAAPRSTNLIPDTAIDLSALRAVDAEGSLSIGRLTLAGGQHLDKLDAHARLHGGRLDVSRFDVTLFGGTLGGTLAVDASRSDPPALTLRAEGKGLDLGAILAAAGMRREVRGGKTDVHVDLAMRGASPRAWAASATGSFKAVIGPATIVNAKADPNATLDKLAGAVNPFRASDPSTELLCGVIRLPLANGVATVDRTFAMETSKLGATASGTLDFREETLDLQIQPRLDKAIPIDISQIAGLVRFTGPFASPHIAVDAAGTASAVATIGAAVATGGISAVGQSFLSHKSDGGARPCQVALGQASPSAATPQAKPGAPNPADDIGKAVGKLFGR